jgi:peptide alpha-N-acetyltransferase
LEAAARVMNDARELDLQDRFINSKSAKYYIRNDKIEEAEKILGLFTRVSYVCVDRPSLPAC